MKFRESGMPEEHIWTEFFNPEQVLYALNVNNEVNTLLDIGCGYGTFINPAAKLVKNNVIGIDIEPEMIEVNKRKIQEQGLDNVTILLGDIENRLIQNELTDFAPKGIDYVCLFNILHCEEPTGLLSTVFNLLNDNGKIGVIHWKYEDTPRGPSMIIRPTPEKIIQWASIAGFLSIKQVELPPYHYGLVFAK